MKTLDEWLVHCEQLHPKAIDLGLERVRAVAQRLGLSFKAPVFMVAGTNGKGSTCAMLEAILLQAGYQIGVYTSPHLIHFQERCRIRGKSSSAIELAAAFELVNEKRAEISLTYFEFSTLAILSLMSKENLDAVILEVGLGGRLDAVNVIDADCAIITGIDLDHTALLGTDREAIALEKAGIMRPGIPVIVSDPDPPESLLKKAHELHVDLWKLGHDFDLSTDKLNWTWVGRGRSHHGLSYPALRGAHQLLNAAGVLAALEVLSHRLPVTAQAVKNGLAMVVFPGRFQIFPGDPVLVLDVAHNAHSVAALTENLKSMGSYRCTHAVFGAMSDKDLIAMFSSIAELIDHWYFTDLPLPRASSAQELAEIWRGIKQASKAKSSVFESPEVALAAAIQAANPSDRILVFGSFFTVGGVLEPGVSIGHISGLKNKS
jgi:dihydrofolate synthase/folylpolyglutamate synthase